MGILYNALGPGGTQLPDGRGAIIVIDVNSGQVRDANGNSIGTFSGGEFTPAVGADLAALIRSSPVTNPTSPLAPIAPVEPGFSIETHNQQESDLVAEMQASGATLNQIIIALNNLRNVSPGGQWVIERSGMSDRAFAYQTQITGNGAFTYLLNGVNFDSYNSQQGLIDAKGPGYALWVENGNFKEFFAGATSLLQQAQSQIRAAGGVPIIWYVAEPTAATAMQNLFNQNGITGIKIVVELPR